MFSHSSFDTFLLSRINESKACGNDEIYSYFKNNHY